MSLIGTRHHARAAAALRNATNEWTSLTGGSCRRVWLHRPTMVVYKVDRDQMNGKDYENEQEIKRFRYLRSRFGGLFVGAFCRLPMTSKFTIDEQTVIAQEYIDGFKPDDVHADHSLYAFVTYGVVELSRLKFQDMHNGNFLVDRTGVVVPIDLASPYDFDSEVWWYN